MIQSRSEKPPSETRQSIRTCIIAQAMGSPLPQVLINGGILSLFIIALGGSKLAVGSVFTVSLGRPFVVPFLKEDLGFPSSVTAYASGALLLGMILGLTPWGRLADRLGNRVVLLANILILSGAFLLMSATPHYASSAAAGVIVAMSAFSLIGVAVGGLGIGHTVRQMYAAPRSSRSSYMAVFFMANGLVGAITSVLAGAMLDHFPASISLAGLDASPIRLFFILVSLLVLTNAILLWNLDPVAEKPIRIAVHNFLYLLPPTLTYPLRIVDLDPHVRGDASQPPSDPPEEHP